MYRSALFTVWHRPTSMASRRRQPQHGHHCARFTIPVVVAALMLMGACVPSVSDVSASRPLVARPNTWRATGSMSTARTGHTATLLPNGRVLVVGGASVVDRPPLRTAELYDPSTGLWTPTTLPMAFPVVVSRVGHTATLLANGLVLVAGGDDGEGGATALLYDPRSGRWTATGRMQQARRDHTATLLPSGQVLVAGGDASGSRGTASAELYDPVRGSWTATGSMQGPRRFHTATLLPDGRVLVAGGAGNDHLSSAEVYDPRKGIWAPTGTMTTARVGHTATLLPNGKVLVTGGCCDASGSVALSSAELYDPITGRWARTADMTSARGGHAATLISDGRVLVAGGTAGGTTGYYGYSYYPAYNPPYLTSTELYDPRTARWTLVGPMNSARAAYTATLLPSGHVLVAGGVNTTISADILADAELFTPGASPSVRLFPTVLSFARQRIGLSSVGQTVTVTNTGTVPLAVSSVGFTATVASDYAITSTCPTMPIAPGQTCAISVRFAPVAAGTHTATLVVTDNAPDSPQLIALSGLGFAASDANRWTATGSMTSVRQEHTATLLPDGTVFVAGGCTRGGFGGEGIDMCSPPLASAELYDRRTGRWTVTGRMGNARADHRAILLSTHAVLVVGGRNDGSAELYDVHRAHWSTTDSLHVPRLAFTATLLSNGQVLVAGGATPDFYQTIEGIASAELYDPARGTWTPTASMATRRWDHTATLLPSGRVLVAGGEAECDQKGGTCTGLSDAELYNPRTGTWRMTGSMIAGRRLHTATLLTNGQVLVVGGYGNDREAPLRSAELYDPRSGTWRTTGSMQTAFVRASATLLPSDQVLVVGIPEDLNNPFNAFNAELYDPRTGRWSAGSMLMKRGGLTATVLPNGNVLVVGGSTASAELYTPKRR